MTFSTYFSPGVALQGGGGSGGGGGAASAPLTGTGATVTTSQPLINVSQTWNNAAVTFTGMQFNAAGTSDANSASASLLMDLQVGGASKFNIDKQGRANIRGVDPQLRLGYLNESQFIINQGILIAASNFQFAWSSSSVGVTTSNADLILTRKGAGNLRLGAADAATPVEQKLSVQGRTGTDAAATAYPFTIQGAQGTGAGAGGSIVFQVAPLGDAGSTPNGFATALTINADRSITVAANASNLANIAMADRGTILSMYTAAFGTQPLRVEAPGGVSIENTTGSYLLGSADTRISRDAAAILGVRGGSSTAPAALSLYTYGASPPAAPAASIVRIYADTSGAKIRLMAIFPSGAAQQIAIEP